LLVAGRMGVNPKRSNVYGVFSSICPPAYEDWLDPDNRDVAQLQELLSARTITDFVFRRVSNRVNSVMVNDPDNIRAIQTAPGKDGTKGF